MNVFRDARGAVFRIEIPLQVSVAVREGYDPVSLPDPESIPAPFRNLVNSVEHEVRFATPDGTKRGGTLLVPKSAGARRRGAVVLLTGSGSQDRDENTPGLSGAGIENDIFRTIAEEITERAGLVTLRCDDMGVGASEMPKEEPGFSTLIDDAASAVAFLRTRPEVDPDRIFLLGHSEGAMIAPALAARRGPLVARRQVDPGAGGGRRPARPLRVLRLRARP